MNIFILLQDNYLKLLAYFKTPALLNTRHVVMTTGDNNHVFALEWCNVVHYALGLECAICFTVVHCQLRNVCSYEYFLKLMGPDHRNRNALAHYQSARFFLPFWCVANGGHIAHSSGGRSHVVRIFAAILPFQTNLG